MGTQAKITGEHVQHNPLALIRDNDSILDDGSAAITATGAGNTPDGNDYIDLGPETGSGVLKAVIRVLNTKTSAGNETYNIAIQLSDATDFNTSGSATFVVNAAEVNPIAAGVAVGTDGDDIAFTRYFSNFVKQEAGGEPVYARYARVLYTLGGTSPSITAVVDCGPEHP